MLIHSGVMLGVDAGESGASERRAQILAAAVGCFERRGFHRTTMQDISEAAGISVGLIYRYFASKEAVIEEMAREHKRQIGEVLERARGARTLEEALRIFFAWGDDEAAHCRGSGYVVELFAEAGRNRHVAERVADVSASIREALSELLSAQGGGLCGRLGMSVEGVVELLLVVRLGQHMNDSLAGGLGADGRAGGGGQPAEFWSWLVSGGGDQAGEGLVD